MYTLLIDFILGSLTMAVWITTVSSRVQDVCFFNTYNVSCADNEVIQMEHALYGRMSIGRCIPENTGYQMGCQEDVLSYLDSVCSGRHSCHLELPDKRLAAVHQPCPRGLESYLKLEYNCIKVQVSPSPCADNPLRVSGTQGLLANFLTSRTSQGSSGCPWEVRGSPGQKVRLTLHDYGARPPHTSQGGGSGARQPGSLPPDRLDICHIYARVAEDPAKGSIPLCGIQTREKVVYLSETEGVQITLSNPKTTKHGAYFLLGYEIIECPNYIPPEGGVVTRHGKDISVRCPTTGSEWRLSCDGTSWNSKGAVIECAEADGPSMSIGALFKSALTLPQWLLIVIIIAAAVIIALPIIVIGILSFRRRHDQVITCDPKRQFDADECLSHSGYCAKEQDPMLNKNDLTGKSVPGREYITTAQRHMAVRPGAVTPVTPGDDIPRLPFAPNACSVHTGNKSMRGKLGQDSYPAEGRNTTLQQDYIDDKNEEPIDLRRMRSESNSSEPFYNEVYEEHTNSLTKSPQENIDAESETISQDPIT